MCTICGRNNLTLSVSAVGRVQQAGTLPPPLPLISEAPQPPSGVATAIHFPQIAFLASCAQGS